MNNLQKTGSFPTLYTMNVIRLTPILLGLIVAAPSWSIYSWIRREQNYDFLWQFFQKSRVEKYAKSITVRVFPENSNKNSGGSGVLIHRAKNQYTIVTNHHVIAQSDRIYEVQTFDNKIHTAEIVYIPESANEIDVGFLVFTSSDHNYPVANLNSELKIETETPVIAGGFPFEDNFKQSQTFQGTEGTISKILERPFLGGYQIGYTNTVIKGMSGGPVLNYEGELLGINGMGKYPLLGNPYTFEDGSTIPDNQWEDFSRLSWAVPIQIIDYFKKKNSF